jgi:cytochrome c oxidase cbb3-type subunit 3/ubiquinol-cytochrome c reductase cytochrome c subunit
MAAFGREYGGPLDRSQIDSLVDYIRSLSRETGTIDDEKDVIVGDADRGRGLYAQVCSHCHGASGEGVVAPKLNEPSFLATASDGFIRDAITLGRPGTPMPSFATMATADVEDIVSYIRTWARNTSSTNVRIEPLPGPNAIVMNPEGAAPNFANARDGRYITSAQLSSVLAARPRLILLDARPTSDWYKAHIPGAYPAPFYNDITPLLSILRDRDTWIVSYCSCPHTAADKVTDDLRAHGYVKTLVVEDGFLSWLHAGYPTTFGRPK